MTDGMTWQETLAGAIEALGVPCEQESYGGDAAVYATYGSNAIPDDFGDDAPGHARILVQLHLFAPMKNNLRTLSGRIARAIYDAGFTFPAITDASDEDAKHLVFEFQTVEETGV